MPIERPRVATGSRLIGGRNEDPATFGNQLNIDQPALVASPVYGSAFQEPVVLAVLQKDACACSASAFSRPVLTR